MGRPDPSGRSADGELQDRAAEASRPCIRNCAGVPCGRRNLRGWAGDSWIRSNPERREFRWVDRRRRLAYSRSPMTSGLEPPQLPDWAEEVAKFTQSINDAMQRAIRANQGALQEAAAAAARHYATIAKPDFQRTIDQLQRLWLRSAPDNWHGLGDEALALTDLVQEWGICLVWVPREMLIRRLLDVDSTTRPAELALLSEEVLEDLEAALAESQMLEFDLRGYPEACAFASEAIAAARDGHWTAAQAVAACGLGQVLHATYGFSTLGQAFKKFSARDVDQATMEILKVALLEVSTARALQNYGDVQPDGFNRHATLHGERKFFSKQTRWQPCFYLSVGFASSSGSRRTTLRCFSIAKTKWDEAWVSGVFSLELETLATSFRSPSPMSGSLRPSPQLRTSFPVGRRPGCQHGRSGSAADSAAEHPVANLANSRCATPPRARPAYVLARVSELGTAL